MTLFLRKNEDKESGVLVFDHFGKPKNLWCGNAPTAYYDKVKKQTVVPMTEEFFVKNGYWEIYPSDVAKADSTSPIFEYLQTLHILLTFGHPEKVAYLYDDYLKYMLEKNLMENKGVTSLFKIESNGALLMELGVSYLMVRHKMNYDNNSVLIEVLDMRGEKYWIDLESVRINQ